VFHRDRVAEDLEQRIDVPEGQLAKGQAIGPGDDPGRG
jgi:hypothetical protein